MWGNLIQDCEGYSMYVYCEKDNLALSLCLSSSFLFVFQSLLFMTLTAWMEEFRDGIRIVRDRDRDREKEKKENDKEGDSGQSLLNHKIRNGYGAIGGGG